jgi:hypothetical protein
MTAAAGSTAVLFPAGLWTLYFHDPDETSYSKSSYSVIAVIDSWEKLWDTFETIDDEYLLSGMYFLMKEPYIPVWEDSKNIKGGVYQIKVTTDKAREGFETYCAAAILGLISTDKKNLIKGVSISSKQRHNIIKIWNNDASTYDKSSDIKVLSQISGDIIYQSNTRKKF